MSGWLSVLIRWKEAALDFAFEHFLQIDIGDPSHVSDVTQVVNAFPQGLGKVPKSPPLIKLIQDNPPQLEYETWAIFRN